VAIAASLISASASLQWALLFAALRLSTAAPERPFALRSLSLYPELLSLIPDRARMAVEQLYVPKRNPGVFRRTMASV